MTSSPKKFTRAAVLASYMETKNLRATCVATGCSAYLAFIWCKTAGVLQLEDKARYGSAASRAGATAEIEFQKLVPQAMPANQAWRANCPAYDFDFQGVLVDVKLSRKNKVGKWEWRLGGKKKHPAHLYAVFLLAGKGIADGYRLLLIPNELFPGQHNGTLHPDDATSYWWDFEVEAASLAKTLAEAIPCYGPNAQKRRTGQ